MYGTIILKAVIYIEVSDKKPSQAFVNRYRSVSELPVLYAFATLADITAVKYTLLCPKA